MSEAELEQRHQASRKHGAYAFQSGGEKALEPRQRSRLAELREQVQSSAGVRELLADRAANAVMMVEIITAYVAREHKMGRPLEKIGVLRALPAFMNTAQRALRDLLAVMPDDQEALQVAQILESYKTNDNGDKKQN